MLIPDAEQIVSRWLQAQAAMIVQVAARTYTIVPDEPLFPLFLVRRIGGQPLGNRPLYHDRALLQGEAYGDRKKQAQEVAETARYLLSLDAFTGLHEVDGDPVGVVAGVEFGAFRWLPDPDYTPAKARYSFDFAVHTHSVAVVGS